MANGVPETEVFQAADAVLTRGERPTVERVRSELGRGSPARVGQLLDQWWEQLAQRLKGHTLLPDLPGEVAQAFAEAWRLALAQGEASARSALVAEQNALFAEQMSLAQERKVWEIALAEAQASVADHATQRIQAERHLDERQLLVDQLVAQVGDLTQQRDRLQSQFDQQQRDLEVLRSERLSAQQHIRTIEDRAHQQVDHARQELKAAQQQLERAQREHAKVTARLVAQEGQLRTALHTAEQLAARRAGRVEALEATLAHSQRVASSATARKAPRRVAMPAKRGVATPRKKKPPK